MSFNRRRIEKIGGNIDRVPWPNSDKTQTKNGRRRKTSRVESSNLSFSSKLHSLRETDFCSDFFALFTRMILNFLPPFSNVLVCTTIGRQIRLDMVHIFTLLQDVRRHLNPHPYSDPIYGNFQHTYVRTYVHSYPIVNSSQYVYAYAGRPPNSWPLF